ncbi:MAG: cytidylate kinase-like family protein [Lachnospiraceae bacterium]|nr:cytidylate kinase-like family protein [Lachnospiraceae bacterium]
MKYKVITISREFAAYGRTIAKRLAEELGLEWYDKDFVKKTAEESGFELEMIQNEGESLSQVDKWVDNIMATVHSGYNSSHDDIFLAQTRVVLELTEKPCIIVGRCANYILREAGIPSFDIFLYASTEARRQRACEMAELDGKHFDPEKDTAEIDKYIRKRDDHRRNYYKKYTGSDMGSCENYTICLDVGTLGVDRCVNILLELLKD